MNGKKRDDDTEALTNLCQKQINYWHKIYPLTDEQISGVKQIAKLAILYRNIRSSSFLEILQKGMSNENGAKTQQNASIRSYYIWRHKECFVL